jgi:phosphate-selective porin OprO/OprP
MIACPAMPAVAEDGALTVKPSLSAQYDIGRVDVPDRLAGAVDESSFSAFRRIEFNLSGRIGAFAYKFEGDLAGEDLRPLDFYLERSAGPVRVRVGNLKNNVGLVPEASSRNDNFLERPAYAESFGIDRRLGAQIRYVTGDATLWGGVFADNLDTILLGDGNRTIVSARAAWALKRGKSQLHLAVGGQHVDFGDPAGRYRRRPNLGLTDDRLVDTGPLQARSEKLVGAEAALVHGPFYIGSEYYRLAVARAGADATFNAFYVEAHWSLTGEARSYGDGKFERPKVARPITAGGPGGLVFAARYDRIDLDDGVVRGGKQTAAGLSMIWTPVDLLRFIVEYQRIAVDGGPYAAAFANDRFNVDMVGTRIQFAF